MKKIIKPQTFRELGKFDVAELSKLVATLPDSLTDMAMVLGEVVQ